MEERISSIDGLADVADELGGEVNGREEEELVIEGLSWIVLPFVCSDTSRQLRGEL